MRLVAAADALDDGRAYGRTQFPGRSIAMKVGKAQLDEPAAQRKSTAGKLRRDATSVAAGAALIFGVLLFDNYWGTGQLEFVIVLVGPLLTGLVMRLRGWPWRLGAAAWALNGLTMLTYDWILNNEDQAYHAVLALVTATLVALGAALARGLLALRSRVSS
jgi:hypothetical protein